jgi:hypothetical protein
MKRTVARPLPLPFTTETLVRVVAAMTQLAALLLHHTAVITVPASIWYACGGIPNALTTALPTSPLVGVAAVSTLMVALWMAELQLSRHAEKQYGSVAPAVNVEVLEQTYNGWQLPASSRSRPGGSASDQPGLLLQTLRQEALIVHKACYGSEGPVPELQNFQGVLELVKR